MKLNAITAATLAALTSYGIGAAALDTGWRGLNLTAEQVAARTSTQSEKAKQFNALDPRANKNATNRVIKHKTVEQKFTPEANLSGEHVYIIQLKDAPVASYQGGVNGFAATALGASQSTQGVSNATQQAAPQKLFSARSANNQAIAPYVNYLKKRQTELVNAASRIGVPLQIQQQFTVTLNAVTATLTQQQAAQLAKLDSVSLIQRSQLHELNSDVGPQVIKADRVWSGEGSHDGLPYKGEGQIIGVIDTGINTDHVSFADVGDDGYDHTNPLGSGNYLGQCQQAEFKNRCNDKLIGVYTWDKISEMYNAIYFQKGYPENPPRWDWEYEQIRPIFGEDYNGHGSHTASTAAGNVIHHAPLQLPSYDDDPATMGAVGDGRDTGLTRKVSGVAPHANVVMYQACYGGDGVSSPYYGCPTEATLASIEQAVLDGVDVINYSISGYGFPWDDAIQQAFYNAYAAGISISASAGNGGFGAYTNHNSPWLLNVAATHHGREFAVEQKTLSDFSGGDGSMPDDITGASISGAITGNIVNAADYGDKSCDSEFAPGTFTADQIVVCERSDQPRMAKANNLVNAGAGGFVLYNQANWGANASLVTEVYPLPSIHISKRDGDALVNWLGMGTGHQATISAAEAYATHDESQINRIASFTSTKENPTFDGTLTPSIAAPGVQVLAAWADEQPFTTYPSAMDWNVIDGTSMAAPHVAGGLALIRQAHPNWSVSQVQSAAQMTAFNQMDDGSGSDPFARAGSGLLNVAAAINSGLIMDENAHNMWLANPENGGDPTSLNLPNLVNTSCQTKCTWIRTVTATKDGSWKVEGAANHDEVSVKITATPSEFTLKAGQSKSIIVTAEILDAVTLNSSPENSYLFGNVSLTPSDTSIPQANWPVKIRFDRADLPRIVNIDANRDNGVYTIKNLPVSKLVSLNAAAFNAVKVTPTRIKVAQDDDTISPYYDADMAGATTYWVDVPMGSKRLFADVIADVATSASSSANRGDLDVFIGKDINNDGEIDFANETICWSYSGVERDYCSITNPEPGKYWLVYHNYKNAFDEQVEDTFDIAYGVISDEIDSRITVSTQTPIDTNTHHVDLDIHWDMNDWQQGDRVYSLLSLGATPDSNDNIGTIALNLSRGANDIQIKTSQSQIKAGDIVDVEVVVAANQTGNDRAFTLNATLPQGLVAIADSVQVNNLTYTQSDITLTEQGIAVTGVQTNTEQLARRYNISTNITDASCAMPLSPTGGYLNLEDHGFKHVFGGHWSDRLELKFSDFFGPGEHQFALYENEEAMPYQGLTISAQGWVQFDGGQQFWPDHYPFSSETLNFMGGTPDTMIAPMLRGSTFDGATGTPLEIAPDWLPGAESTGVTMVYNDSPKAILVEWDDVRTETPMWDWMTDETSWLSWGDNYDFQAYINIEYQYGDNQPEVVMAYDNIRFANADELPVQPWFLGVNDASIGLYGFHGPRGTFGPTYGGLGEQFAYGDVSKVLQNNLVVCYDYEGPESSQFTLSFKAQADNTVTGRTLELEVQSDVAGINQTSAKASLSSRSNLQVATLNDVEINEDSALEDLVINYTDADRNANVITVTGEHISAVVNGHESGATVTITPEANFSGSTVVTVTVADKYFAGDAASSSFTLTVVGENDAPTAVAVTSTSSVVEGSKVMLSAEGSNDIDGDIITYLWQGPGTIADNSAMNTEVSGLSAGTHEFVLTVSDGEASSESTVSVTVTANVVAEPQSDSSSGSLAGLLGLLAMMLYVRRRN